MFGFFKKCLPFFSFHYMLHSRGNSQCLLTQALKQFTFESLRFSLWVAIDTQGALAGFPSKCTQEVRCLKFFIRFQSAQYCLWQWIAFDAFWRALYSRKCIMLDNRSWTWLVVYWRKLACFKYKGLDQRFKFKVIEWICPLIFYRFICLSWNIVRVMVCYSDILGNPFRDLNQTQQAIGTLPTWKSCARWIIISDQANFVPLGKSRLTICFNVYFLRIFDWPIVLHCVFISSMTVGEKTDQQQLKTTNHGNWNEIQ